MDETHTGSEKAVISELDGTGDDSQSIEEALRAKIVIIQRNVKLSLNANPSYEVNGLTVISANQENPTLKDERPAARGIKIYLSGLQELEDSIRKFDPSQARAIGELIRKGKTTAFRLQPLNNNPLGEKALNAEGYLLAELERNFDWFIKKALERSEKREAIPEPAVSIDPIIAEKRTVTEQERRQKQNVMFEHADAISSIYDTSLLTGPIDENRIMAILQEKAPKLAKECMESNFSPLYMRQLSQVAWVLEYGQTIHNNAQDEEIHPDTHMHNKSTELLVRVMNQLGNNQTANPEEIQEILIIGAATRRSAAIPHLEQLEKGFREILPHQNHVYNPKTSGAKSIREKVKSIQDDCRIANLTSYHYLGTNPTMYNGVNTNAGDIATYWNRAFEHAMVAQTAAAMLSAHVSVEGMKGSMLSTQVEKHEKILGERLNDLSACGTLLEKIKGPLNEKLRGELYSRMAQEPNHTATTSVYLAADWKSTRQHWGNLQDAAYRHAVVEAPLNHSALSSQTPAGATVLANYIHALEDKSSFVKDLSAAFAKHYEGVAVEDARIPMKEPQGRSKTRKINPFQVPSTWKDALKPETSEAQPEVRER